MQNNAKLIKMQYNNVIEIKVAISIHHTMCLKGYIYINLCFKVGNPHIQFVKIYNKDI